MHTRITKDANRAQVTSRLYLASTIREPTGDMRESGDRHASAMRYPTAAPVLVGLLQIVALAATAWSSIRQAALVGSTIDWVSTFVHVSEPGS